MNKIECEFDFRACALTTRSQMLGLRQSAGKTAYPKALVNELLCSVYPLELAWSELSACFTDMMDENDLPSAINKVAAILQRHRAVVEEDIQSCFARGFRNAGISDEWLTTTADMATRGDNSQVEELEFAFACYAARSPVVAQWAARGLMGMSKSDAFGAVLGMLFAGSLDSYASASGLFGQAIAAHIGGGTFVTATYRPMPPLW